MIKRCLDFITSFFLIVLLLPIFMWVYILTMFFLGRPVFFVQTRSGINGKAFKMYKFRTMSNMKNENGVLLPDEQRLTTYGRFLRSTSIDELPELINVLLGDMSLVGPRPLLIEYVSRYSSEQKRRLEVRPGITGWAQINGRNSITWDQKFLLDVWYVDNRSLWLDLKILFLTAHRVFTRQGVNTRANMAMPVFYGSQGDDVDRE